MWGWHYMHSNLFTLGSLYRVQMMQLSQGNFPTVFEGYCRSMTKLTYLNTPCGEHIYLLHWTQSHFQCFWKKHAAHNRKKKTYISSCECFQMKYEGQNNEKKKRKKREKKKKKKRKLKCRKKKKKVRMTVSCIFWENHRAFQRCQHSLRRRVAFWKGLKGQMPIGLITSKKSKPCPFHCPLLMTQSCCWLLLIPF